MPEVVGGVVYEVDVTLDKANTKLRQFEGNVAATGKRADAALATGFQGGAIAPKLDAATAASTRLSNSQRVLQTSSRAATQALIAQTGAASQFGVAAGGVAAALPAIGVGAIAVAAGFQLIDSALKSITGAGAIDHLFGRADDIDRANRALAVQKQLEEEIKRLRREGLSGDQAKAAQLGDELTRALSIRKELAQEEARLRDVVLQRLKENPDQPGQPSLFPEIFKGGQIGVADAQAKAKGQFQDVATAIKGLELSYKDLLVVTQRFPELAGPLTKELEAQAKAAGLASASFDRYSVIVDAALAKQGKLAQAQSDLASLVGNALDLDMGPQILALEQEEAHLDALKTKMGDAFGKANQARLTEVGRLLDLLKSKQDLVGLSVAQFANQVAHAYGDLAPAAIENVAAALSQLPAEQQIQIAVLLPDLFPLQAAFANFIASLQAGANVIVAIRMASVAQFGTSVKGQSFLGGGIETLPGFKPGDMPSQGALDFEQQLADKLNDLNKNAVGPLGAVADKSAEKVQKFTAIFADGIISLGEALDEGWTVAQAAAIEQTHQAELAVWALRDAQFRLELETIKAANGTVELQIALVQIAAELIRTGKSAEEFSLDNVKSELTDIASQLDDIFNKPTKESLALDLQKAKLERQALLLEQGGADASRVKDGKGSKADKQLASVEKQIDTLDREIDLREKELEIIKLETELKDQTLQTDQDLLNANAFLAGVITQLSADAANLSDALGVRVFNAALSAAAALQAVGGYTAAQKHWINGVAISRGEPVPFPGFESGLEMVPTTMPVVVHPREAILTAPQADRWRAEQRAGESGMRPDSITISVYGVTDPERVADTVMRRMEDRDRMKRRGLYATSSPYQGV